MRLDDSEAKSESGTSPSNGSGSQDSIDSLDEILMNGNIFDTPERAYFMETRAKVLAWHNTQLKAAIPLKRPEQDADGENYWNQGYNSAIEDLQANLEKL